MEHREAKSPTLSNLRSMGWRAAKRALSQTADAMGLYRIAASRYAGLGVILTLHRVSPTSDGILQWGYTISAEWLESMLRAIRKAGWDIVSMDDVVQRLAHGDARSRRFVCFTLDDGYADNLEVALPVFRRLNAPFTVYVTTGFLNRSIFYWWGGLEELVSREDTVETPPIRGQQPLRFDTSTWWRKRQTFYQIDALCHREGEAFASELLGRYRIDARAVLDRDALSLSQARQLASDPLVTIGAHSIAHRRISQLSPVQAHDEIAGSKRELEGLLETAVKHFAYPFGGADACGKREVELVRQAGYESAVTTRRGNVFSEHRSHTACLPRRGVPNDLVALRNAMCGVESFVRHEAVFQTL